MNRYEEIEKSIRYLRKMQMENRIKYYHYMMADDDVSADRIDGVNRGLIIGMNELYSLLSERDQEEVNVYDDKEQKLQDQLNELYQEYLEEVKYG